MLLSSGALFGGSGFGLNAADELPPELDSLLQLWSDDLRPIEDRLSTFDRMYRQFYEQYPATMLRELEVLRLKVRNSIVLLSCTRRSFEKAACWLTKEKPQRPYWLMMRRNG